MREQRVEAARWLAAAIALAVLGSSASAGGESYAAGQMWGTAPGGVSVNGADDSAYSHLVNGEVAGTVNAAKSGTLLDTGGGGLSIYSIGTQTIVSSTIVGNDNSATIQASQSATNSGGVSNQGTINNH